MIELININKSYGDNQIYDNFSYCIKKNKITSIFGASGCGKTTLLRIIMKLEKPDSGEIIINNGEKYKLSAVFQEHRLLPWATAFDNVNLIVNNKEKSMYWLDNVGLSDAIGKYPSEMSGGMNQRVALARALAYDSGILIMDEPFRALDIVLKDKIIEFILNERNKRTVVLVTHEKDIIEEISDDIIYL